MSHEDGDIPPKLKWLMTFINRVGFPILVSMALFYLVFVTQKEQTKALDNFSTIIGSMRNSIDNNTEAVKRLVEAIYRTRHG